MSAMETAGKEDMPEDAERKGLGTPATRAAIIEKLLAAGFVERKGKSLIPTKAGVNLVTVLPEPMTSPMLTAEWEQLQEFAANVDYFVLEPNIRSLNDLGWRYLAQHMDVLLPPELLDAIDPVPFGNHAMREEQGCFTSKGYLTLSGDEWEHERPREKQTEKKLPSRSGWNRAGKSV